MKKRRIVVSAFLLLAVLVMGIGFASLTDNLFIKGEAQISTTAAQQDFDADVYFIQEGTGKVSNTGGSNAIPEGLSETATVGATDNDSVTFNIYSLGKQGEYVIFSFAIQNVSTEFDASISLDSGYPTTTNSAFSISYSVDESGEGSTGPIVCAAGSTTTVYVKVTLTASPETNVTSAFNVNLTATSQPKATTPIE